VNTLSARLGLTDLRFLLLVSALYLLLSGSLLLSWPLLLPDEAAFADAARGVLLTGHPATALIDGMGSTSCWQPPGWFYLMAPVIALCGFGILPLRVVSMCVGLIVIWATWMFARQIGASRWASRAGILLLALNPNFITYVKLARMDGLCVLFTMLGLTAYARYRTLGGTGRIALSSALFAVALLMHPFGILGPTSAASHMLLVRRNEAIPILRAILLFLAATVVALMLWILSAGSWADFAFQVGFQIGRKAHAFPAPLIAFAERYRSLPLFGLMIPVCLSGVWLEFRRSKSSPMLLLAIGATVSTAVAACAFEIPYHVYCLPLLSVVCGSFIDRWGGGRGAMRAIAGVLLIAVAGNFVAYTGFFNYEFHYALRRDTDYAGLTSAIEERIPPGSAICLTGYPYPWWGLRTAGRDYRLFDEIFLSDSLGIDVARRAEWFVLVNGLSPEDNRPDVVTQFSLMRKYAGMAGKTLSLKDFVGRKSAFAYTVRIYRLVPIVAETDSPLLARADPPGSGISIAHAYPPR